MRFLVPIVAAALAACAPDPQAPTGDAVDSAASSGRAAAPDALYREALLRSERLGRALYQKDIATARATDLLLEAGMLAGDERITGWVTQESEGSFLVTYVADQVGRKVVGHEIAFPGGLSGTPTILPTPPNSPLIGERAVMYAARETAIAELRPLCNTNYNTVVLPGSMIGEQGWLVYLLAATMNPGEHVFAGHALVRVSANGLISLGATPLSLSCLIVPVDLPEGTEAAGNYMTHLTTDWPLETHVYTNLLYGLPVFVGTQSGTWKVDAGRIELMDPATGR